MHANPHWLLIHLVAAVIPLLTLGSPQKVATSNFPGWPAEFQGVELHELPLQATEERMRENFPGEVARFTDGRRELIFRWVTRPTRKLHPARDCFRAAGYSLKDARMRVDTDGHYWSCFIAARRSDGHRSRVCEQIHDGNEQSWSDPSAWYWSAFLRQSSGPWWSTIVSEPL